MGTLALANMVPRIEPDWMNDRFHKHSNLGFLFVATLSANSLRLIWLQPNVFWMSENWLAGCVVSGSKFSDSLTIMSASRSGRHQHGQLLQGRWVKVLMAVVTPQTGRGEGSQRHTIRGGALHCEGLVERATYFDLLQTEHKYQTWLKSRWMSSDLYLWTAEEIQIFAFRNYNRVPR